MQYGELSPTPATMPSPARRAAPSNREPKQTLSPLSCFCRGVFLITATEKYLRQLVSSYHHPVQNLPAVFTRPTHYHLGPTWPQFPSNLTTVCGL